MPNKICKVGIFFFFFVECILFIYLFMVIYSLDIISNFCKEVNAFFFFFLSECILIIYLWYYIVRILFQILFLGYPVIDQSITEILFFFFKI
jgi:hypothetical protein